MHLREYYNRQQPVAQERENGDDKEILCKVAAPLGLFCYSPWPSGSHVILWDDGPLHEMQNSRGDPLHPGALGWGTKTYSVQGPGFKSFFGGGILYLNALN